MTTLADFIDEVRTSLEDNGDSITDNFSGDNATTVWKMSSTPLKTNSETITVGGVVQTRVTNYTVNYNNGEVTFTAAPGSAVAVVMKYTKVVWRDERIISAINAGIRRLFPLVAYKIGECYILLRPEVYDYDLSSAVDVPAAANFTDQTIPSDYNSSTARTDLLKAQSRIHLGKYRPYGANQLYTDYEFFYRSTPRNLHIYGDPAPNDTLKLIYTAPFTVLVNTNDPTDVPDELYMAPVWYALSVLLEKKEGKRARSDGYHVMQNANANPPGTQSQTADDFLARYNSLVADNSMRPYPMQQRRSLRRFQLYAQGS